MTKPRIAIVLFNLGGPDRPESIRPFLVNLFTDPAILRVNFLVRPFLARLIAAARVKPATENYTHIGGRSPLLELTEQQARALEAELPEYEARCFIAMRYWHPMSEAVAQEVRDWNPDRVLLLPLYPQYSTTTTGSSLTAWREAAAKVALVKPTTALCCYYGDHGFTDATAAIVRRAWDGARAALPAGQLLRILFSAHGLPKVIIDNGDPYQFQIERTVADTVQRLGIRDLDYAICYQSRATPQEWIGPSTEEEIERAGRDQAAVLVVPIAFVSEHTETLVELDIEYKEFAQHAGVTQYFRAPAPNSDAGFIAALAGLVRRMHSFGPGACSHLGGRTCPVPHTDCPFARADPRERVRSR
jgi:ferrochelatase